MLELYKGTESEVVRTQTRSLNLSEANYKCMKVRDWEIIFKRYNSEDAMLNISSI